MLKNKICLLFLSILILLGISACTTPEGQYKVLSDRRLPLSAVTFVNSNREIGKASAVSRRHVVMVIPFSKAPTLEAAVEEILNYYKGDYIANAEVEQQTFHIPFLYHYKAWKVSGTVVKVHR